MDIGFVTGNVHKFREANQILGGIKQLDIDLLEIQSLDVYEVVRHKLNEAASHHRGSFMVTDMSLQLKCLNGLPGPLIKWFMTTIGSEGLFQLTAAFGEFGAEAKLVIGFMDENKKIHFFEGVVRGSIVAPRGVHGFAWDDVFIPEGFSKTFAEMTPLGKNEISMFKIALEKLKVFLDQNKKSFNE